MRIGRETISMKFFHRTEIVNIICSIKFISGIVHNVFTTTPSVGIGPSADAICRLNFPKYFEDKMQAEFKAC